MIYLRHIILVHANSPIRRWRKSAALNSDLSQVFALQNFHNDDNDDIVYHYEISQHKCRHSQNRAFA